MTESGRNPTTIAESWLLLRDVVTCSNQLLKQTLEDPMDDEPRPGLGATPPFAFARLDLIVLLVQILVLTHPRFGTVVAQPTPYPGPYPYTRATMIRGPYDTH